MKLLDTNICISILNGRDKAVARRFRDEEDDIVLCSIVKGELLFGARASGRVAENLRSLTKLFELLPSLPFDDDAASKYGELRAELRRQGTPIGPNDMLIAAIALVHRATVITRNVKEFERVPELAVVRW